MYYHHCFTEHNFNFTGKQTGVYFPLLVKYYAEVPITATLRNHQDTKEFKDGKITEEWFAQLCTMGTVTEETSITLVTDRFWSEYACIRTLPRFVASTNADNDAHVAETASIVSAAVDQVIRSRTNSGGGEVFHSSKFSSSWENVVQAVDRITETKDITRLLLVGTTFP